MIVAIEGPSAAGKTTWCRSHFPDRHVPEIPENIAAPDLFADPAEVGHFWVNHATANWQKALALEREHGIAVCDGDPFHLYYSWALWKTGTLARGLFGIESELYRTALQNQQIGFVDHVLWLDVPEEELRRRAMADRTRRRKRHEMYLAIVPWMKEWFEARESFTRGTVRELRDDLRVAELRPLPESSRYDARTLDHMFAQLAP
jgi:hypothetical protein